MIDKLKNISKDELLKGSFILFVMICVYNLFNYFFQVSMAKLLGPSDYGVFAVLMSIVYIFAIPSETIQTIITKYTAAFNAKNESGKIKDLLQRGLRKFFLIALFIFALYVVISFFLSPFLNIDVSLIIFTGLFIFIVFTVPVVRGVLQGTKHFMGLGLNMVSEAVIKLILSVLAVTVGMQVYGAILGVILGSFFALLLAFTPLRSITSAKRKNESFSNLYITNLPILFATLSIVLMYSIDIILARAFFPPEVSGQFAFVSLIGKIIVFVSSAIGKALFPLSTEGFEKGKNTLSLLKKSILAVLLLCFASLILYYFVPEQVIYLLSLGSTQYMEASHVLFILGLAYSLMSIANIVLLYNLSINKMKKSSAVLLVFVLIEIFLLSTFNSTLHEYAMSLLLSGFLILLYSLLLLLKRN